MDMEKNGVGGKAERKLTPKQAMFVREYLVDLNATQAAIRAGYSARTAEWQGPQLLGKPHVSAAIQTQMDKRAAKIEITADLVLQEIAKLAFANPQDYYNKNGSPKEIGELTREQAAAINSIKTNMTMDCAVVELKLHDKKASLELLGKHLVLFTERTEVVVGEAREKSDEELLRFCAANGFVQAVKG